jgi:type I restriction enzyme R subunit
VTPGNVRKTHFVLVDAVGVCEQMKNDEPPLERKRSVSFAKLLDGLALGAHDDDTLSTLASRLGRLAPHLKPQEAAAITDAAGGRTIRDLAQGLVAALDPDRRLAAAQAATGQAEPGARALRQAAQQLAQEAAQPFDNPALRDALKDAQRRDEQVIDPQPDVILTAGADAQAKDRAERVATSFRENIEQHHDEITALAVLYSRPHRARLQFGDIKDLARAISQPPLGLTADALWQAYRQLDRDRVRGANDHRTLTDLVTLVRYALERDRDQRAVLAPYSDEVRNRFAAWLGEQERRRGRPFTTEQRQWLALIRDHIATAAEVRRADFDEVPFNQQGGLGRAWQLFGDELDTLVQAANEGLAA